MENIWIIILAQSIVFGGFCSFIAKEKNRGAFSWFILGFLFSLISVLALIAVPKLEGKSSKVDEENPNKIIVPPPQMNDGGQSIVNTLKNIFLGSNK